MVTGARTFRPSSASIFFQFYFLKQIIKSFVYDAHYDNFNLRFYKQRQINSYYTFNLKREEQNFYRIISARLLKSVNTTSKYIKAYYTKLCYILLPKSENAFTEMQLTMLQNISKSSICI